LSFCFTVIFSSFKMGVLFFRESWGSSVSVVTRLRAGRSAVRASGGARGLSLLQKSIRTWGRNSLLFSGCRRSFLAVKRLGTQVNHSYPSSAEIRNGWSYACTPPTRLHGMDMENFTLFTFFFSSLFNCSVPRKRKRRKRMRHTC
jgi:hypothetical protein